MIEASSTELDSLELDVAAAAAAEAAPRKRLRPRKASASSGRLEACRQRLAMIRAQLRRLRELSPSELCEAARRSEQATAHMLRNHPHGEEALAVLSRQQ